MTNLVQNLEECWYISPPWGQRIPPLLMSLLERAVGEVVSCGGCVRLTVEYLNWDNELWIIDSD